VIPTGPDLGNCFPTGSLLKGSAADVYVVQSGLKRHVVDLRNFVTRGYSFSDVKSIPDGWLDTVPTGQPLLDLFATGSLIKGGAPDVYVMDGGVKRHATSLEIFSACGYKFDAVITVPQSTLESIPNTGGLEAGNCPQRTFADGTVLRGSGAGIWVVEGGQKRSAVSIPVFESCGHDLGNLNTVADSTLAAIPVGPALSTC